MTADRTFEGGPNAAPRNEGIVRMLGIVGPAWVLCLGFDLFLHAGLLARLYIGAHPFLLRPEAAFRRIPLGYLSFLLLTLSQYWLFRRLGIRGVATGFRHGGAVGLVVWGALALGLYSISTAEPPLLLGWCIGQAVELGLAGAVLGAAAAGGSLTRIWVVVALVVVGFVTGTIVLQTLGLAPAMRVVQ